MSFTYGGNPGQNKLDYCRFVIGDTRESGHILEDAEILYFVDKYTIDGKLDDLQLRAALFRQAATMYAIKATKRALGPQSEDTKDRLAYFTAEAEKAEERLRFSGTPPIPEYSCDKIFDKHMMANDR